MISLVTHNILKQLDRDDMELIAITSEYILVKWRRDDSYVSWKWVYDNHQYNFSYGIYMPCMSTTETEALMAFAKRISK